MSIAEKFAAYVMAFERTFEDDDWARLEPFFTEDAVYRTGGGQEIRGRRDVFAHLKESLDTFDRRFDLRTVELTAEPEVAEEQVTIRWRATYTKGDLPEVVLSGTEVATFEGDAIAHLEDIMAEGVLEAMEAWMQQHGHHLG